MPVDDIRVPVSYPQDPDTRKIIAMMGPAAVYYHISLQCWAAIHRPSTGDFYGLLPAEIAQYANCPVMMADQFIDVMLKANVISRSKKGYKFKNWAKTQPYVVEFKKRSAHGQKMNKKRWHKRLSAIPEGLPGDASGNPPIHPSYPYHTIPNLSIQDSVEYRERYIAVRGLFEKHFKSDLDVDDFNKLINGNGQYPGFESIAKLEFAMNCIALKYKNKRIESPVGLLIDFLKKPNGDYLSDAQVDEYSRLR